MSVSNFSFLACLEVAEKFVVGGVGWYGQSGFSWVPRVPAVGDMLRYWRQVLTKQ